MNLVHFCVSSFISNYFFFLFVFSSPGPAVFPYVKSPSPLSLYTQPCVSWKCASPIVDPRFSLCSSFEGIVMIRSERSVIHINMGKTTFPLFCVLSAGLCTYAGLLWYCYASARVNGDAGERQWMFAHTSTYTYTHFPTNVKLHWIKTSHISALSLHFPLDFAFLTLFIKPACSFSFLFPFICLFPIDSYQRFLLFFFFLTSVFLPV